LPKPQVSCPWRSAPPRGLGPPGLYGFVLGRFGGCRAAARTALPLATTCPSVAASRFHPASVSAPAVSAESRPAPGARFLRPTDRRAWKGEP
jgi:hypothetical protein